MSLEKKSRTVASKKNVIYGVIFQFLTLLITFAGRSFFVHALGTEYLGLDGLFKNILNMLSFTELGIGVAITSSLYRPLAQEDYGQIKALLNLLRKVYTIIVLVILATGSILIVYLPEFINGAMPDGARVAFAVYILNAAASYFLVVNRTLLIADQNGYINTLNQFVFSTIAQIAQIFVLLWLHSYIVYLLVLFISTVASNFVLKYRVRLLYPFLDDKDSGHVSKQTKKQLLQNVIGMVSSKIGGIVLNSTDNLVLSYFVGLSVVGLYSNYLIVVNGLTTILNAGMSALTASLGNLGTEGDTKKEESTFYKLFLGNALVLYIASLGMVLFFSDFVTVWVGVKYVLPTQTMVAIVFLFFFNQLRQVAISFQIAHSLFWQQRYKSLFEAVTNLVISVLLVKGFNLAILGVVLGTIASNLLINSWWEPVIVFKSGLKASMSKYYTLFVITMFVEVLVITVGVVADGFLVNLVVKSMFFMIVSVLIVLISVGLSKNLRLLAIKVLRA
ncbi:hypothetical protein DWV22_10730 [Weissella confusa]|uniref:oligosaccharide flippase family protein n=1 Tax=Weissella confusa TaxID=1583 RepID=UPI000E51B70F|nr:oligosaccharide flippase family protein [Weissella confusa]RGX43788.1 hypothetical protein DWV22_10730 [Weissella confusa]